MVEIVPPIEPIQDRARGYRSWLRAEIYTGPYGTGKWVPNVNDSVIDWDQGFFRVYEVDDTTKLSKMRKVQFPGDAGVQPEDILLGAGPGYQSESFRMYLDTSVVPHKLAPDRRTRLYGKDARYYKVFTGSDINDPNAKVISANYDAGGTFLGENVPLELAVMSNVENVAVMYPAQGYTMQKLNDGEVVTLALYDDEGSVLSLQRMLILNTAFMRASEAGKKYITGISLDSAFIDSADQKVIRFPINMPVQNMGLYGVIHYSDGTVERLPIDGTRFSLYGLDNYVSTIENQRVPLSLVYRLSPTDYSVNHDVSLNRTITEDYWAITTKIDGALSVKLFMYPVWISAAAGYRMTYWLCNLDRNKVYRLLDEHVQLGPNSAPFDPTAYGVLQKLDVVVDLNKVDGIFPKMRHTQSFEIALLTRGDSQQTNWSIGFDPAQDPPYGIGLAAKMTFVNVNNSKLRLDNDRQSLGEWLKDVFYNTKPLYNADLETQAPEPTHFVLVFNSREIEYPISQWNSELTVPNDLVQGAVLYIKFIKREPSNVYVLGVSGLSVHMNPVPNTV